MATPPPHLRPRAWLPRTASRVTTARVMMADAHGAASRGAHVVGAGCSAEMRISRDGNLQLGDRHLRDRDLRRGYRTSSTRGHMRCPCMSDAAQHMRCRPRSCVHKDPLATTTAYTISSGWLVRPQLYVLAGPPGEGTSAACGLQKPLEFAKVLLNSRGNGKTFFVRESIY